MFLGLMDTKLEFLLYKIKTITFPSGSLIIKVTMCHSLLSKSIEKVPL